MSGRASKCRKGCCWTPLDVCAKRGNCSCHMAPGLRGDAAVANSVGISLDELARRRALRTMEEGTPAQRRKAKAGGTWKRKS